MRYLLHSPSFGLAWLVQIVECWNFLGAGEDIFKFLKQGSFEIPHVVEESIFE